MDKKLHIANCLLNYAKSNAIRLHMPGHKGDVASGVGELFPYDITELSFSDNLADASGVIELAQKDIAKICGAKKSFILTGGSSLGVLSMVYAVKNRGRKMLVARSSHKSVLNALALCNIEPIFLNEQVINGLPQPIFENISELENLDNDVIGALITSPNYFGRAFDLKNIANILHLQGKLLLVDGAHGSHFVFDNPSFYPASFADLWVDGAHKTLYTLTQGAILHLNEMSLENEIKNALSIFSTSSPSYPIMASVESGVKGFCNIKKANYSEFVIAKQIVENALIQKGFNLIQSDDPLKITIDLNGLTKGSDLVEILESNEIYMELANDDYLLFMLSYKFDEKSARKVADVILGVSTKKRERAFLKNHYPQRKISYIKAISAESELVKITKSHGRICAENAGVFPPCYPLILAGEVFDNSVISRLLNEKTFGCYGDEVRVVKEEEGC